MKKLMFMCMLALLGIIMVSWTNSESKQSDDATVATHIASMFMDEAINMGYGTVAQKQKIQDSKVIETTVEEFMSNGYNLVAAVDKGIETTVNKGWFKNKTAAKKHLRNTIETERKKESNWQMLYNMLGL